LKPDLIENYIHHYYKIVKTEIFIKSDINPQFMAGGNPQESHCELGFDSNRTTMDNLVDTLKVVTSLIDLGGGKMGIYCAGHRYVTAETLPRLDIHYKQRGMSVNAEGVLLNLHGAPICEGCAYHKKE
jgi:hypothetical protein